LAVIGKLSNFKVEVVMQFMRKFILLVLLQALMAGAAFAQAKPAARATEAEAKAFAEKAIAHIKAVGAEKAYADFNARDGKWTDRELYVIVIAFDGTMRVHGTVAALVGKNETERRDMNGKLMTAEMIEVAKTKGTGWVDYVWPNPVTKKFEPKSTYVIRVPGADAFLGVGIYK